MSDGEGAPRDLAPARRPAWLLPAATLALATGVLFVRRPDAFLQPRFSAEDGTVFFKQALEEGPGAFLIPDAGYMHLVPRLVAMAASFLPSVAAPWVYSYACLACLLVVGAFVFSPRLRLPLPALLVLCLVAVPDLGETLMTLRTVQWVLALLLPLVYLADSPGSRREALFDIAAVALVGFSTPYVVPATLLFAVRRYERRDAHSGVLLAVSVAAACAHIAAATARYGASSYENYGLSHWIHVLGVRLGGTLVLGPGRTAEFPTEQLFALTLLYAAIPLLLLRKDPERLRIAAAMTFLAGMVLAAGFYKTGKHPVDLSRFENGSRHFYIPQVALLWSAALLASGRGLRAGAGVLLLALTAFAAATGGGFRVPPIPDRDWNALARRIDAGERVRVPVDPNGWSFEVQKPR